MVVSQVSRRSREILKGKGYGEGNVYVRGLMFKKEVNNQIEKGQEEKARKELQGCTFKPKIHRIH
jgi:hypothetical protein